MVAEIETIRVRLTGDGTSYQKMLRQANRRAKQFERQITAAGRSLTLKLTVPIVGATVAVFKLGAAFESEMSKIQGLVGIAGDKVAAFSDEILKLAPTLGKSPKELAQGLFFVTSAGFRGAKAIDVLTIAAKASAGGLGDVATVADAMTSAINAYGEANLSAARAGDILVAAIREGKLEASQLAPVIGSILPTASAMGIAFEDIAGILAVFSKTGTSAAEGATSLQAIMSTLLKPTNDARKLIEDAGLSMKELREIAAGPGGLIQVMRLLDEAFEGNQDVLANLIPNVRAFRGVMNALAQDAEAVDAVMNGVANSAGSVDAAFAAASATAEFQFNQSLSSMKVLLIELGKDVIPIVNEILIQLSMHLQEATTWWRELDSSTKKTIVTSVLLAATLGPILLTIGLITKALIALKFVVLGLSIALKVLRVSILLVSNALLFLLRNPIVLILVLIAVAVLHLTGAFKKLLDIVKGFSDEAGDAFGDGSEAADKLTKKLKEVEDQFAANEKAQIKQNQLEKEAVRNKFAEQIKERAKQAKLAAEAHRKQAVANKKAQEADKLAKKQAKEAAQAQRKADRIRKDDLRKLKSDLKDIDRETRKSSQSFIQRANSVSRASVEALSRISEFSTLRREQVKERTRETAEKKSKASQRAARISKSLTKRGVGVQKPLKPLTRAGRFNLGVTTDLFKRLQEAKKAGDAAGIDAAKRNILAVRSRVEEGKQGIGKTRFNELARRFAPKETGLAFGGGGDPNSLQFQKEMNDSLKRLVDLAEAKEDVIEVEPLDLD